VLYCHYYEDVCTSYCTVNLKFLPKQFLPSFALGFSPQQYDEDE
jgi:hypothetical protein